MNDDSNDRLHERLAALRRVTVKRGASKAEAETAKRLADQLAKRLGKEGRRRRRRGPRVILPEPPQARRKRLWLIWLEDALIKIACAGCLLHGVWVATVVIVIVATLFGIGSNKQVTDLYFARTLILLAVGLLLVVSAAVLAVVIWWLRTLPGERLRAALLGFGRHLPAGLIMIVATIGGGALEWVVGKGWLGFACYFAAVAVGGAVMTAWYDWAHPLLQRKLRSIWCSPSCGRTT